MDGQGPEHSSARLERFLQNCAAYNMVIANITTPANFFHAMRRQITWNFRKPLVVMSPKSLLRHPKVTSPIADFTKGCFQEIIDDAVVKAKDVKRVLLCTGKVYYDLLEKQEKDNRKDVAIVRFEQLYPLAQGQVNAIIEKYKGAEFVWVQEEPSNMGAWQYILAFYRNYNIELIGCKSSASPATGYKSQHDAEQKHIVDRAFA